MADGYNGDHPEGNDQIVIGQLHPEALSLFLGFYFLRFAFFLPQPNAQMTVTKACDAPFTEPAGGPSLQITAPAPTSPNLPSLLCVPGIWTSPGSASVP